MELPRIKLTKTQERELAAYKEGYNKGFKRGYKNGEKDAIKRIDKSMKEGRYE